MVHGITSLGEEKTCYGAWDYFSPQAQAQECVLEQQLMEWGKEGVTTNARLAREAAMVSDEFFCLVHLVTQYHRCRRLGLLGLESTAVKVSAFKPGLGENMALLALPNVRNSAIVHSAFLVQSCQSFTL